MTLSYNLTRNEGILSATGLTIEPRFYMGWHPGARSTKGTLRPFPLSSFQEPL